MADEVGADSADDPVVREHLGGIDSISALYRDDLTHPEEDVYVCDVVGPRGTARVEVESIDGGAGEHVVRGELFLPDGRRFDLRPE